MIQNTHHFVHDRIEGTVIRVLDDEITTPNAFLPVEWQLESPPEFRFAYTCCYVRHRDRHVLIDAGFEPDTVPGALETLDLAPEDVDLVLLTHADRDHVGGLLMLDGALTYPNARHVISAELWETLRDPATLDRLDPERGAFYRRLVDAFDARLHLPEDEAELVDEGIRFLSSSGHRPGHAAYELLTDTSPLLHTGDVFFHPLFIEHPTWPSTADSHAEQAADTRRQLAQRAAITQALVAGSHLPFPGLGHIEPAHGAYRWVRQS